MDKPVKPKWLRRPVPDPAVLAKHEGTHGWTAAPYGL